MSAASSLLQVVKNMLSGSGDAIKTTTYSDDFISQGRSGRANDIITMTAGQKIAWLVDLSLIPSTDGFFMLPINIKSSEEEVQLRMYESPVNPVAGTAFSMINPNRLSDFVPDYIITQGATYDSEGLQIFAHAAFAASGRISQTPDSGSGSSPNILDTSKYYIIELENIGTGATEVEYDTVVYQIPFE